MPKARLLLYAAVGAAGFLCGSILPGSASWIGRLRLFASPTPAHNVGVPPEPAWVASAPGRVEPVSGEVRLHSLILGRVSAVLVKVNDRIEAGDLLVRLDDEEARARLAAAEAQAALREHERDRVPVRGALADLRKAEDRAADAERALAAARRRGDGLTEGRAEPAALAKARQAVVRALRRLESARDELARRKARTAAEPGAGDAALAVARADLAAAEALLEKTRVRAPIAGTILRLPVRAGETVAPSHPHPIAVVGDISALRVRADLDERSRWQVFVGQAGLVRAGSFADPFNGKVATIAPALAPAQAPAGGRRRPQDNGTVEVLVEIAGPARLIPGMHVDVFFLKSDAGQPGPSSAREVTPH